MKKLATAFLAAAFMAAPAISFAAQDAPSETVIILNEQDKEKKEVDLNKLPNEVSAALKGPEYAGWLPEKAWKMKTDDGWVYKVKLKKGEETRKVKFTKDGKPMKEMDS